MLFAGAVVAAAGLVALPAAAAERDTEVTFSKHVAPILQRSCQNCHRPSSVAPMSLLTYEETRPWARSIKDKTALREMPPWFIDKTIGIQEPGSYVLRALAHDIALKSSREVTVTDR